MRDGQTRLGDGEAITEYRKEANPSRAYSLEASVIAQRNVNFHCPEARLVSDIRALFANVPPKQPASAFVAEHSDLIHQRIKQPEISLHSRPKFSLSPGDCGLPINFIEIEM